MAVATFEVLYETIAMTEFSNIIELQTRREPTQFQIDLSADSQYLHNTPTYVRMHGEPGEPLQL